MGNVYYSNGQIHKRRCIKKRDNTISIDTILFALPLSIVGFLLVELPDFYFELSNELIFSLAFNGILASFVLTIIHTTYQRYTTPVKAALIFSMEPIFASIFATMFMAEVLTNKQIIGATILMVGVLTSELGSFVYKKLKKMLIKN